MTVGSIQKNNIVMLLFYNSNILVRYNSSTQQLVEIRVKNVEAEEFMNPHR